MSNYNKTSFHNYTFCIWNEVLFDEIKDLKITFNSKSGSAYIVVKDGIFRISNHWGRVANCRWRLDALSNYKNQNTAVGFANWSDFFAIDQTSKLYFIKVNFEKKSVNYFHKNSNQYDNKAILRTATATSKVIQSIKIILNETSWAKHLLFKDFLQLQKEIIIEMIYTEKSFIEIKRKYI